MEAGRTKNSVRNITTGILLKVVSLLLPFVVRTIIIKKLGMDYLGLNSLFTSILSVLSLSELGFSTSVAFALYKPLQNEEIDKVCCLLNLLRKIYYIVGSVVLLAGLAVMPFLPKLISGTYPSDVNIYILYLVYLFNTVVSYFLFSYKSVLLSASQRSDIENNISLVSALFLHIAQAVVLLLFSNYYIYIAFLPVSTLAINIIREITTRKKFPQYVAKGSLEKCEKKAVYSKIKALIGHRLSGTIVGSTDSLFISAFLGLTPLAQYNNYYYIVSSCLAFNAIFLSSITASIGNMVAFDSKEKNYRVFLNLTYLNVWLVGWMSITLMTLYQPFMRLWVGEEDMLPTLTALLLTIYFYSWRFKDILVTFKDASGMWNIDFWKPYVVSILNILLDWLLVYYFGVDGVIIATILSVPLVSLPWETQAFFKAYFKLSPKNYYLRLLVYTIILIAVGCLTYWVCSFIPSGEDTYGWFVLKAVVCFVLPNAIIIPLSLKTTEFKWVLSMMKKVLNRGNGKKTMSETVSQGAQIGQPEKPDQSDENSRGGH